MMVINYDIASSFAYDLVNLISSYLPNADVFSLFFAFGAVMLTTSYIFGYLISIGFGFAKFIFETLVKLIKELINYDR